MLPGGANARRFGTVVLTLVLVVSCFGSAVAFAGLGDGGSAPPAPPSSESGTLHPDLEDAEGEVTVVVRFPELGNDRAVRRSERVQSGEMRSHAARTQAAFDAFVDERAGVRVERSFWVANAKLVTVDTDAVDLRELAAVEGVREVHPNFRIEATSGTATGSVETDSADGGLRATYGLELINAPAVWDRFGTKGAGVSVAVLDSGVDPDHPDIDITEDRWAEFDDNGDRVDSSPYDSGDHGTHTSATVTGGNASGEYVGVASEATLYHGKVLEGSSGTWASVIAGIEWAAEEAGVDVVSMSLGAETYYSGLIDPIRNANDLGVVVVASAGNDGEGTSGSPGNVYDSVAVGAVDSERAVADFSSGEPVDTGSAWGSDAPDDWPDEYVVPNVAAPGVDVKSAVPGGYASKSGTSMAAPHVAGTVALVRAAGGDHLSQAEVRALLERTAEKPEGAPDGMDTRYGAGIVDAYNATVHGTADSTVSGRVLDADGEPVAGSRVETEFGYGVDADADGNYSIDVPDVEQTLTVDAYGYESETVVVDPGEGAERDVVLANSTLQVRSTTAPERVDPGRNATYEFEVANVTAVTVEAVGGTLDESEATLRIEGESVAFGERRTFAEPQRAESFTVEVETSADAAGTLELEHAFEDGVTTVTRTTPRTHVHPDPLVVPADYDPADLQSAVDVAAPGTTVVLEERAGTYDLAVDETADEDSGLALSKPLTLRAADGHAPVLSVPEHDGETSVVALDVDAADVTVSDVDVEANGADVGVRVAGADATVEGTEVRNATVAFDVRGDVRARDVAFGDGRSVHFDATDVTVSSAAAPAEPPEDVEGFGWFAEVRPNGDAPAADLAVEYDAADVTRLQNDTLGTRRYDEADDAWVAVDGFDAPEDWVTASLDAFGVVAPMGEQRPPEFVVEDLETRAEVVAGEELTVNATVRNEGVQDGPQDVEFRLDGETVASEPLRLEENETARVSLSHVVDADRSGGTVGHGVATADDERSAEVRIVEPARFAVDDLAAPNAIQRGETLAVDAIVENAGDLDGERRVELRLGPDLDDDYDVLAAENRSLAAGESANLSFAAAVPADAATGTVEVGVVADGDARAAIDVSRVSGTLNGTVLEAGSGEPVTDASVVATADTTGETFRTTTDAAGAYRLDLPVGNYSVAASAPAHESAEVDGVAVAEGETTTVDVEAARLPLYFDVRDVEAPTTVEAGETFEVVATVANLGTETGEESVELRVDGEAVDSRPLELATATEGTVALETSVQQNGTVELTVASGETAASTSLEVEAADDHAGSGGQVGGAPIGGGGAPPAPPSQGGDEETADGDSTVGETADIVDAAPARSGVNVPLEGVVSEITFRSEEASGTLTVREGVEDDLPSPPGEALEQLEIQVPEALAEEPATVRATVDPRSVDGRVTMYRHADGGWQPLETTVTATGGGLVIEAETPGFSRFALVDESPAGPSAAEETETETPAATATPTATDGTPTADDGAGFGGWVALVALVGGLLAVRRTGPR
jgi:subtilisin family serine protease